MTVLYNISNSAEFTGATVLFSDGSTYPVSSDHPKFKKITKKLLAGDATEDEIFALVAPFDAVFKNLTKISERISRRGMNLYFDGDVLGGAVGKAILKAIDEEGFSGSQDGKVWPSYVNFLENLMTNPSEESRQHLYHYVSSNGLTITPDGYVVFYKGVNNTDDKNIFASTRRGPGIITRPDGSIEEIVNDNLPNAVGYVVSLPRSVVDESRDRTCSSGLHVGTHKYAKEYGNTLLTVLVHPRDVVAVPNDANNQKIRVARYEVLEINGRHAGFKEGVVDARAEVKKDSVAGGSRIEEYKALIPELLKNGVSLRKFKSKNVTAKRRDEFKEAARQLGHDLS